MPIVYKRSFYPIFEKIHDESLPPKPKELVRTCRRFWFVSTSVTGEKFNDSIFSEKFRLAGIKPRVRHNIEMTASIAPDALVVCPVKAFVEDIGGTLSPKMRIKA